MQGWVGAGLVWWRVGLVQGWVGAGLVWWRVGLIRVGLVRVGLVRVGLVRVGLVQGVPRSSCALFSRTIFWTKEFLEQNLSKLYSYEQVSAGLIFLLRNSMHLRGKGGGNRAFYCEAAGNLCFFRDILQDFCDVCTEIRPLSEEYFVRV